MLNSSAKGHGSWHLNPRGERINIQLILQRAEILDYGIRIIRLCGASLRRVERRGREFFNVPIKLQYTGFFIELPANHLLADYQRRYPRYDKFLPHLARYLSPRDTVIDIGANVGDTLANMVESNRTAHYICIEPDDSFHNLLDQNVERMRSAITGLNVRTIKAFVGKSVSNVTLEGTGGTKHAVVNKGGSVRSFALDELILDASSVRLLKSDVDGFDWDVLDSSMAVIENHKPMIFFECQHDYEYQQAGYARTLAALEQIGYHDWIVFDNFGEVVLRTGDHTLIIQLMEYVRKQNSGKSTRTIFYYDVLATQKKDSGLIDKVLSEY